MDRKQNILAIIAGLLALVMLVLGFLLINQKKNPSHEQSADERTGGSPYSSTEGADGLGGDGIGLTGSSQQIVGSVQSLRNLSGLLVQVNQIDVCTAPDAVAYISLTNEKGEVFTDLRKPDIQILVDGKEFRDFELSTVKTENLPLNSVLALDKSGSMAGAPIEQLKVAANSYIDKIEADDTLGLLSFDTSLNVLHRSSKDKAALKSSVNGLAAKGDTALFDAMKQASDLSVNCGRRAVLLMSDGEDTASKQANAQQAINAANSKNVPVFVVGLNSQGFRPDVARNLAESTGAQYFETTDPNQLRSIYDKIDNQLSGQYLVRFKLNLQKENKERRLEIRIGQGDDQTKSERSFVY